MSKAWRIGLLGSGGVGLLLLALIVVAIVSGGPDNTAQSGSGQEQEEGEGKQKSSSKSKGGSGSVEVGVGRAAELDDRTLTVAEVERGYTPNNRFSKAESGNEYMRVWITLTNTSNQPVNYNQFDFEIQDSNGVQKRGAAVPDIPRELGSGDLAPDGKVEGNLVSEIPREDNNLGLIYTTNMFSGETIAVRPLQ